MRASKSSLRDPQYPINTDQTCISNRFEPERSANHKEIRRNAANFNKFLARHRLAKCHPERSRPRNADGAVEGSAVAFGGPYRPQKKRCSFSPRLGAKRTLNSTLAPNEMARHFAGPFRHLTNLGCPKSLAFGDLRSEERRVWKGFSSR